MQTFYSIQKLIDNIAFPGKNIYAGDMDSGYYLQVVFFADCAHGGERKEWRGRKWYVSSHSTDSEIIQTCFKALLTSAEHETRERFKYKGKAIFAPHYNVDKLLQLAEDPEALDVRQ